MFFVSFFLSVYTIVNDDHLNYEYIEHKKRAPKIITQKYNNTKPCMYNMPDEYSAFDCETNAKYLYNSNTFQWNTYIYNSSIY